MGEEMGLARLRLMPRLRIGRMRNPIDGVSRQELSTGRRSHVIQKDLHIPAPHFPAAPMVRKELLKLQG